MASSKPPIKESVVYLCNAVAEATEAAMKPLQSLRMFQYIESERRFKTQTPQTPRRFHYVELRQGIYYTVEELNSFDNDISAFLAEYHKVVEKKVRTPTKEVTARIFVSKNKEDWDYVELDKDGEPISIDGYVATLGEPVTLDEYLLKIRTQYGRLPLEVLEEIFHNRGESVSILEISNALKKLILDRKIDFDISRIITNNGIIRFIVEPL